MAKTDSIELTRSGEIERIPILYEDRSVLAIDKPPGWMLVPAHWRRTERNLQAAIESSIAGRDFWSRSRNLKFLRYVHRLDAETSGVLLLAKSPGAVDAYGDLFESRKVEKVYLAVVHGEPRQSEWVCTLKLSATDSASGRVKVDSRRGREAETCFRVLQARDDPALGQLALVEARPLTGRTHQIRVHLAQSGHPVMGDRLYGRGQKAGSLLPGLTRFPLGLRAACLSYVDPFQKRRVRIEAPMKEFAEAFGFGVGDSASASAK